MDFNLLRKSHDICVHLDIVFMSCTYSKISTHTYMPYARGMYTVTQYPKRYTQLGICLHTDIAYPDGI